MKTKKVNLFFTKIGHFKAEIAEELLNGDKEKLENYLYELVQDKSDEEVIEALADVDKKQWRQYGMFDSDNIVVEKVEDEETFDTLHESLEYSYYTDPTALENLVNENKEMGEFLENKLGFPQERVTDIAIGVQSLFAVHVVFFNELKSYKLYVDKEEAEKAYLSKCKEWYKEDGFNMFKAGMDEAGLSEMELYERYVGSEQYLDACDNARVKLEVI